MIRSVFISCGIATTFVGTIVGAGFASGREVLQFFARFGLNGVFGVFIALVLLGIVSQKIIAQSLFLKSENYSDFFAQIWGKRIVPIIDVAFFVIMEILVGVMFAGCGEVFEQWGFDYRFGFFVSAVILLAALSRGFSGLLMVNGLVVPLMFLTTATICLRSTGTSTFEQFNFQNSGWITAALQFASYNIILALPVLQACAQHYRQRTRCLIGGVWLGILVLGTMMFLMLGALLRNFSQIVNLELPLSLMAGKWHVFYEVLIWGEMLSTLLSNLFALGKRWAKGDQSSFLIKVLCLIVVGIFIAEIGFARLIAEIYPKIGWLGMIAIVGILMKSNFDISRK